MNDNIAQIFKKHAVNTLQLADDITTMVDDILDTFIEIEKEISKIQDNSIDLSNLPLALETIAAHIREKENTKQAATPKFNTAAQLFSTKTINTLNLSDHSMIKRNVTTRDMDTDAVTNVLPKMGFYSKRTLNWLTEEGYLQKVEHPYVPNSTVRVPTDRGKDFFEAKNTCGLYVTKLGFDFLNQIKELNFIPISCLK